MENRVSEAYAILRRAGIQPEPWAYNWKIAEIAAQIINTNVAHCNRSMGDYFGYGFGAGDSNLACEQRLKDVMEHAKKIVDAACQFRIVND